MKVDPQTTFRLLGEKAKAESQDSTLQGLQKLKSGLSPPGASSGKVDPAQARKAAENFESYFLFYVLKGMREAFTDGDPLLEGEDGGGFQGSVFKEMLDEELGKTMAQSGGVGLADMILKQLGVPAERNLVSPSRAGSTLVRSPSASSESDSTAERSGFRLNRPVPGAITSSFGARPDPITGKPDKHEGVDLRAAEGDHVQSAAAGIVIFSGEKPGYGRMVEVLHADGYSTIYAHLKQPLVERGDFVSRGGLVGRAGDTGRATGPHVHLELKKDGEPINPEPYLLEA